MEIKIGNRLVGDGHPVFIIAEIGINHNGDINIAKRLIDVAADAGCDAVKFQKRTPHLCVPPEQMKVMRDTPWGKMNYLQYRYKVEFEEKQYDEINAYCKKADIMWFVSCWDIPSVDFFDKYDLPCYKIASASFTDVELIEYIAAKKKPVLASCGMSSEKEIQNYFKIIDPPKQILLHTNSSYPAPIEELNLKSISSLREKYDTLIGYSGHEVGLFTTPLAVAMGACCIERHITLDRNMWGTDQGASVEPKGLYKLVEEIRTAEAAMGDGVKKIYPSEEIAKTKLRRKRITRPTGKTGIIVQARMGSQRLPGKVLADLAGKPLLERLIERLKLCKHADEIIIAIPDGTDDDQLVPVIEKQNVTYYRGDEFDVLGRYLEAAKTNGIDYIVRVPADNPCISPKEIDKLIEFFMVTAFDFCSNLYEIQGNGYPDGIGAEIFTTKTLDEVGAKARTGEYREHLHRYFYDHLNVGTLMCPPEYAYPNLKLDVNTKEELEYIQSIYECLQSSKRMFDIEDIVEWHLKNKPEILQAPSLEKYKAPIFNKYV